MIEGIITITFIAWAIWAWTKSDKEARKLVDEINGK
jgi:hypothetical protein